MAKDKVLQYSDAELEVFRQNIMMSKDETMEEISMLKDRLEDLNSSNSAEETSTYGMHMGDQGTEAQEMEKTYAQIQRMNDYLKKLDEALERIDNKVYGICKECSILIAKQRLLAVPVTTLSASFKIHEKCPEDGIDRIHPLG